jgi:hypothetical protein
MRGHMIFVDHECVSPAGHWNFEVVSIFCGNLLILGLDLYIWSVKPSLQIAGLVIKVIFWFRNHIGREPYIWLCECGLVCLNDSLNCNKCQTSDSRVF